MAKLTCKVVKTSGKFNIASHPGSKANGADYQLNVGQGDEVTVTGADDAGNPVDLSGSHTLTVTSADPTAVEIVSVTGMTYKEKALKAVPPGSPVIVTVVATPNGGGADITIGDPVHTTGPANALVITHGTPTIS